MTAIPQLRTAGRWLSGAALPRKLAVGWSGGADSTALLLALKQAGYEVSAWHVDHGWRAESSSESETLRERAAVWGIPFCSARIDAAIESNREAESRHGRYACFELFAAEEGIDALALAHHFDDQAETVALRMLQGAGVMGCRGMAAERSHGGLTIHRPLLHLQRSEIVSALEEAGVDWFEDPSNADLSLLRNHIRHRLFPAIDSAGEQPARLFLRWRVQAVALAEAIGKRSGSIDIEFDTGAASLDWQQWSESSAPVRAELLQRMMAGLFGSGRVLGRRHIELIERWRAQGARAGLDLTRCRISRRKGNLHLARAEANLR